MRPLREADISRLLKIPISIPSLSSPRSVSAYISSEMYLNQPDGRAESHGICSLRNISMPDVLEWHERGRESSTRRIDHTPTIRKHRDPPKSPVVTGNHATSIAPPAPRSARANIVKDNTARVDAPRDSRRMHRARRRAGLYAAARTTPLDRTPLLPPGSRELRASPARSLASISQPGFVRRGTPDLDRQ